MSATAINSLIIQTINHKNCCKNAYELFLFLFLFLFVFATLFSILECPSNLLKQQQQKFNTYILLLLSLVVHMLECGLNHCYCLPRNHEQQQELLFSKLLTTCRAFSSSNTQFTSVVCQVNNVYTLLLSARHPTNFALKSF